MTRKCTCMQHCLLPKSTELAACCVPVANSCSHESNTKNIKEHENYQFPGYNTLLLPVSTHASAWLHETGMFVSGHSLPLSLLLTLNNIYSFARFATE